MPGALKPIVVRKPPLSPAMALATTRSLIATCTVAPGPASPRKRIESPGRISAGRLLVSSVGAPPTAVVLAAALVAVASGVCVAVAVGAATAISNGFETAMT